MNTISELLAEKYLNVKGEEIPESTWEVAKKFVLDTMACAIGGTDQPGTNECLNAIKKWEGKGEASVIGIPNISLPLPNAAFINSVLIHSLDYDDVYGPGSLHVNSVVFSPVLGVAEKLNSTGRDFLLSFIIAVDASCKIGLIMGHRYRNITPLPTSIICGFGAILGVSKLICNDKERTVNAMGINYSQTCGNRQALLDMTLTKRIQPAFAARNALWAIALADEGITGPTSVFEGKCGFCDLYTSIKPPSKKKVKEILNNSKEWEIEQLSVKKYPCCGSIHSLIEAALRITKRYKIEYSEIDHVEISWNGKSKIALVDNVFEMGRHPQVNAQFSAPYMVAVALTKGKIIPKFITDEAVKKDIRSWELAKRVYMVDMDDVPQPSPPKLPKGWERFPYYHSVKVFMKNGDIFSEHVCPGELFMPENSTWNDVVKKFYECAEISKSVSKPDKIISIIKELDRASSIRELIYAINTPLNR